MSDLTQEEANLAVATALQRQVTVLTRERDEARAARDAYKDAAWRNAEAARILGEKLDKEKAATDGARAIARRLRAALESDQHVDMLSDAWFRAVEEAKAACAAFDALSWAKDDA
jgi:hypothetical protein